MGRIIRDENNDRQLAEKGFAIIPVLDSNEINLLLEFYNKNHPEIIDQMYASAHSQDITYRKRMSNKIKEIAKPKIMDLLDEVKVLGGSFIVKGNSPEATLPAHQDWNIVDENKFRSFNLWLPLIDTFKENGGLCVLPKSHLFQKNYRGPNISSIFEKVHKELMPHLVYLNIPAGHGLLFDHRLLHGSGVNQSNHMRITTVFGIIEEQAQMKFYYKANNQVDEYECDSSFFMEGNPQEGPKGLLLNKSIPWDFLAYNKRSIRKLLIQNGYNHSILSKIKNIFNK